MGAPPEAGVWEANPPEEEPSIAEQRDGSGGQPVPRDTGWHPSQRWFFATYCRTRREGPAKEGSPPGSVGR